MQYPTREHLADFFRACERSPRFPRECRLRYWIAVLATSSRSAEQRRSIEPGLGNSEREHESWVSRLRHGYILFMNVAVKTHPA